MKYLTFLSYCTDYCGCALTYVSNYCTPAIKLPCLSLHEMSLGRQRSALSVFQIFLIGCLSSFQSCPFPLNLCGLICIEVTHLKDAAPLGCVVVIIYHLRSPPEKRGPDVGSLSLKWFRMHRRSPAPPRCATASPPPLCTCSRCSCPLVSLFGTAERAG